MSTATARRAPTPELQTATEFFETLYGPDAPGYLNIFTAPGLESRWHPASDAQKAARYALNCAPHRKVYFGIGLHQRMPLKGRGAADGVCAIPALWYDLDIASEAHKQPDLPADLETALEFVRSLPLQPSILVHSGHGLQLYWLFKEPHTFDTAEEREQAARLVSGWQATIGGLAKARGWTLDNTADLARVFRVPGTLNRKLEPVPVRILESRPTRFNPDDFEPFRTETAAPSQARPAGGRTALIAEILRPSWQNGRRNLVSLHFGGWAAKTSMPREEAFGVVEALVEPGDDREKVLDNIRRSYDKVRAGSPVKGFTELQDVLSADQIAALDALLYPKRATSSQRADSAAAAGASIGYDEPARPLFRDMGEPDPFPVAALQALAPVARAIQSKVQAPIAICAQSVLAAASLAVQAHANVVLPTGEEKPVGDYFATVAGSGERKTSADRLALQPHSERETELQEIYADEYPRFRNARDVWEKARQRVLNDKKGLPATKRAELDALGDEPTPPLFPMLTTAEPTFEGLFRLFATGHPSLGIFADEGGQFVGGHGMTPENIMRTATGLSKVWDGDVLKRVRAGDGASALPGRRLTLHLMMQPGIASTLLSDPLLFDQGFLSRLLVTAPQSTAGTRYWREPDADAETEHEQYRRRMLAILRRPYPLADGKINQLAPRRLTMTTDARRLWIAFADNVEGQLGASKPLEPIRGLANKLPEHAARLAAVLTLVQDLDAQNIPGEAMAAGIDLAQHYAAEALRLFEAGQINGELNEASRLLAWLRDGWKEPAVSLPDIYQLGPNSVREARKARHLVNLLVEHGWLCPIDGGAVVAGKKRREAWRIRGRDE